LIQAAIFDYGETLVCPNAPNQMIVPKAMLAAYGVFVNAGLKETFGDFLAADIQVFSRWGEVEAQENRDIPDIVKYQELVGQFFPNRSERWRMRVAAQANGWFWNVVANNYCLAKGAKRTLDELESMGLRMMVLSNHHNHRALVKHLKQLNLDRYFVGILSSVQLGVRKPDPRAFEKCLTTLEVGNDEAIFVGDSISHDIAGAKAAGMKAILVKQGRRKSISRDQPSKTHTPKPDFTIHSLCQVPTIVRRLNSLVP